MLALRPRYITEFGTHKLHNVRKRHWLSINQQIYKFELETKVTSDIMYLLALPTTDKIHLMSIRIFSCNNMAYVFLTRHNREYPFLHSLHGLFITGFYFHTICVCISTKVNDPTYSTKSGLTNCLTITLKKQ